jgi:hypothetical protein
VTVGGEAASAPVLLSTPVLGAQSAPTLSTGIESMGGASNPSSGPASPVRAKTGRKKGALGSPNRSRPTPQGQLPYAYSNVPTPLGPNGLPIDFSNGALQQQNGPPAARIRQSQQQQQFYGQQYMQNMQFAQFAQNGAPQQNGGYRQQFNQHFYSGAPQQQFNGNDGQYGSGYQYPMAQFAPAAQYAQQLQQQAGGEQSQYPATASVGAPVAGLLPAFPVPFAHPPFSALLASVPLPYESAPIYSLDIECVATGLGHNDRAMGHVAVVDQFLNIVLNIYVKPARPVASYLPNLTGLSAAEVEGGVTDAEALAIFRATIPRTAILTGQNILKDVQWLGLVEGEDFASMLDLAALFATKNPRFNTLTFFSLAHEAKALLCLDQRETHHPAIDAWLSVKLYQLYTLLKANPSELERARALLLELPVEAAFSKKFPIYDTVCMGNRKLCTCGSPWFF